MAFPHPPNTVYPTPTTASFSAPLNTFHQIPMARFNDIDNSGFYSTPCASGEFDANPFLSQKSASNEEELVQAHPFADGWGMGGHPDYMVGSPTSLRAEASLGKSNCSTLVDRRLTCYSSESVSSVTCNAVQTHRYEQEQPSYPGHFWPMAGQYAQLRHSSAVSWDTARTVELEASTVIPTPSSGKYLL